MRNASDRAVLPGKIAPISARGSLSGNIVSPPISSRRFVARRVYMVTNSQYHRHSEANSSPANAASASGAEAQPGRPAGPTPPGRPGPRRCSARVSAPRCSARVSRPRRPGDRRSRRAGSGDPADEGPEQGLGPEPANGPIDGLQLGVGLRTGVERGLVCRITLRSAGVVGLDLVAHLVKDLVHR